MINLCFQPGRDQFPDFAENFLGDVDELAAVF